MFIQTGKAIGYGALLLGMVAVQPCYAQLSAVPMNEPAPIAMSSRSEKNEGPRPVPRRAPLAANAPLAPQEQTDEAATDTAKQLKQRELDQPMRELQEQRRQLMSDFQAIQRETTHQGSSRTRRVPELDRMRRELEGRSNDRADRSRRLQEQVSKLRDMLRDAPACQPEEHDTPQPIADPLPPLDQLGTPPEPPVVPGPEQHGPPVPPVATTPHATPHATPQLDDPHETATVATPTPATDPSAMSTVLRDRLKEDPQHLSPHDADHVVEALISATTVTDHPIDRVGLANNLYGTGEFRLALDIYQKISLAELDPVERLWIQFQMANCHRRLGNVAEANRGYRIVTGQNSKSWIGQFAYWWLDSSTKLEDARIRIDELNRTSQMLKEPVNASNRNP